MFTIEHGNLIFSEFFQKKSSREKTAFFIIFLVDEDG